MEATHILGDRPLYKEGRWFFFLDDGKRMSPRYQNDLKPIMDCDKAVAAIQTHPRQRVVKLRTEHLALAFEALRRGTAQDMFGNIALLKDRNVVHLSVQRPDRDGQNHYRFEFGEFTEYEVEVL